MSMRAVLELHCEDLGIPTYGYAPASIKKSFTGSGRANKGDMKRECEKRGIEAVDDNHADAIAVFHHHKLAKEGKLDD
jgi:Holliday junction resolvasome RuvABC endonuclease subunit